MVELHIVTIENVPLLCPEGFELAAGRIDEYPSCCGAGKGLGDKAVPETIYGLNISPACHVHDFCFDTFPRSLVMFFLANCLFIFNICMLIFHTRGSKLWLRPFRLARAGLYLWAVHTIGKKLFFKGASGTV